MGAKCYQFGARCHQYNLRAAWMNNLVAAETPMGAEDELRRLRLREKELAKRKRTEDDKGVGEPQEDTLSGSSEDAKKKRKKKKKKDKVRVVGTKSPAALFATTALDPKRRCGGESGEEQGALQRGEARRSQRARQGARR